MHMMSGCKPNFNFTPSPTPCTEEQSTISHKMHTFQFVDDNIYIYIYELNIESVDSISRDEPDSP